MNTYTVASIFHNRMNLCIKLMLNTNWTNDTKLYWKWLLQVNLPHRSDLINEDALISIRWERVSPSTKRTLGKLMPIFKQILEKRRDFILTTMEERTMELKTWKAATKNKDYRGTPPKKKVFLPVMRKVDNSGEQWSNLRVTEKDTRWFKLDFAKIRDRKGRAIERVGVSMYSLSVVNWKRVGNVQDR